MIETQNYRNHVRYYPLVHYFLSPVLVFNLIWQIVRLFQEPSWDRGESLLLAVALIALSVAARLQALKAQDRVIRLEETLRYHKILAPDLAARALELPFGKMRALRFAPDGELTDLVRRTLSDEFKTPKEIKLAIKNWRGVYFGV